MGTELREGLGEPIPGRGCKGSEMGTSWEHTGDMKKVNDTV